MPSITLTYGATSKTLVLDQWRIRRRRKTRVFEYFNGGKDIKGDSANLLFHLKWRYLSTTDYADVVAVVNQIRSGTSVKITALTDFDYLYDSKILERDVSVELENDEVLESAGEWLEGVPGYEIELITRKGHPAIIGAKHLLWGDEDTTFDEVGDDQFREYD